MVKKAGLLTKFLVACVTVASSTDMWCLGISAKLAYSYWQDTHLSYHSAFILPLIWKDMEINIIKPTCSMLDLKYVYT